MSTPAERLLKAAEILETRASEATEGPWEVGSINHPLRSHRTWHLESVERFRGLRNNVDLGEDEATAHYIATMHPGVGKAVAKVLRIEAEMTAGAGMGWAFDEAVALADLVLAGEQEQVEP